MSDQQLPMFDLAGEMNRANLRLRTKAGALTSSTLKAVQWYCIEHGLKPDASSALPLLRFTDAAGNHHEADIADVVAAYEAFKQEKHGRRHA